MGRVVLRIVLVMVLLLVVGCAGGAGGHLDFCEGAKVLRPAKGETARLSESLKSQIAGHNETGRDACGWRP